MKTKNGQNFIYRYITHVVSSVLVSLYGSIKVCKIIYKMMYYNDDAFDINHKALYNINIYTETQTLWVKYMYLYSNTKYTFIYKYMSLYAWKCGIYLSASSSGQSQTLKNIEAWDTSMEKNCAGKV